MNTRFLLCASALALGVSFASPSYAAISSDDPEILFKEGEFFGEVRYRFESVDQDNALTDASAHTSRINVGYKTGVYKGFQALAEVQVVQQFNDNFNDTVNGNTTTSVIADPDAEELNQLWFSYSGVPDTVAKLGRQKINIDNQRFVGTVNWRQNDQTFDSVLLTNSSIPGLDLMYGYVWNVNRIFGDDARLGDLDSDTHIAHASYKFADWFKASAYGYFLEFDEAPALSSETYGLRFTGKAPISDDWSFFYEAEAATQSDYGNNTASYDEEYYHIAPGIKGHGLTFQLGYEVLGGDGTNSFSTPLATLHKFNGFADVFLNTPANGLEDAYVKAAYKVNGVNEWLDGTKFVVFHHEFEGEEGGDFGSETDLVLTRTFKLPEELPFKTLTPTLKFADYDAEDAPYVDEQVFWFQLSLKF